MKLELNQNEISEAIINKAVDELLGDKGRMYDLIRKEASERISAAIEKRLNNAVEEALNTIMEHALNGEVSPVNVWGEREGDPTTIRAALHDRAKSFWSEQVDKNGKRNNYSGVPRYEHVLSVITAHEFDSAVKQNIANIAGAVKDAVRKDFYDAVDVKLDAFFKINSSTDQKRNKSCT